MTRPISLAALTVLELTPPEMVDCAAEAGFSHVGIRLLPATPTEPQYDIVGDTPLLREVERRLADTGVKVLDVEIFRLKPDTRVGDYEAAIATGARLGASELLVAANDPDEDRLKSERPEVALVVRPGKARTLIGGIHQFADAHLARK